MDPVSPWRFFFYSKSTPPSYTLFAHNLTPTPPIPPKKSSFFYTPKKSYTIPFNRSQKKKIPPPPFFYKIPKMKHARFRPSYTQPPKIIRSGSPFLQSILPPPRVQHLHHPPSRYTFPTITILYLFVSPYTPSLSISLPSYPSLPTPCLKRKKSEIPVGKIYSMSYISMICVLLVNDRVRVF